MNDTYIEGLIELIESWAETVLPEGTPFDPDYKRTFPILELVRLRGEMRGAAEALRFVEKK